MIKWNLDKIMTKYRINNKELGKILGKHETNIRIMRKHQTMPRINGDDLNKICTGLTKTIKEAYEIDIKIALTDLLEYIPD